MCRSIVLSDCDTNERIFRCISFNRPMNTPHTVIPGALLALPPSPIACSSWVHKGKARYILTCKTRSRGAREREIGGGRERKRE